METGWLFCAHIRSDLNLISNAQFDVIKSNFFAVSQCIFFGISHITWNEGIRYIYLFWECTKIWTYKLQMFSGPSPESEVPVYFQTQRTNSVKWPILMYYTCTLRKDAVPSVQMVTSKQIIVLQIRPSQVLAQMLIWDNVARLLFRYSCQTRCGFLSLGRRGH